ncbi:MAG: hypothetical protein ACSHYB_10705 [Roseibacillus sp.]
MMKNQNDTTEEAKPQANSPAGQICGAASCSTSEQRPLRDVTVARLLSDYSKALADLEEDHGIQVDWPPETYALMLDLELQLGRLKAIVPFP